MFPSPSPSTALRLPQVDKVHYQNDREESSEFQALLQVGICCFTCLVAQLWAEEVPVAVQQWVLRSHAAFSDLSGVCGNLCHLPFVSFLFQDPFGCLLSQPVSLYGFAAFFC